MIVGELSSIGEEEGEVGSEVCAADTLIDTNKDKTTNTDAITDAKTDTDKTTDKTMNGSSDETGNDIKDHGDGVQVREHEDEHKHRCATFKVLGTGLGVYKG